MADLGEVVFRLRVCRGCNAVFSICRRCDRGQRYCSPECRVPALREQRRRANHRHQCSPEGRLDHRDRQREYRKRCAQRRVTDTPSPALMLPGSISACHPRSTETAIRIAYTAFSLRYRWLASWRGRSGKDSPGFTSLCCLWSLRPFRGRGCLGGPFDGQASQEPGRSASNCAGTQ